MINPPDDSWKFFYELAQAIGSVATAAALGFVGWQTYLFKKQISLEIQKTNQAQEESKLTFRPWIGFVSVNQQYGKLVYRIKNYGRLPARVVGLYTYFGSEKITSDELKNKETRKIDEFTLFPDQEDGISVDMPDGYESIDFDFGMVVAYTYSDTNKVKSAAIGFVKENLHHFSWTHAE